MGIEKLFGTAPYESAERSAERMDYKIQQRRTRVSAAVAVASACALVLAGCGGTGAQNSAGPAAGYTPGVLSRDYAGQTITVLLPPWGQKKPEEIKKFEDKTGIKVEMQNLAYDSIHDKIVTSEAAHQAPADVIELDWIWLSQFSKGGWLTDLTPYLGKDLLDDLIGSDIFTSDGKLYGMPYSLDFRGTAYNMTMLKNAGIEDVPRSWDDLVTAAKAVKEAGIVDYPISVSLSVTEGTSTAWFSLARSSGGSILSENGEPAFADDAVTIGALDLFHTMYQDGLIDPGATKQNDQQSNDNVAGGNAAIVLAAAPGAKTMLTDPTKSVVYEDDFRFSSTPTQSGGPGATIGLEEALGIPAQSEHKEAAAMFLTWWMTADQLLETYQDPDQGLLPPSRKMLQSMASNGVLSPEIAEATQNVQPIIPGGAPTWYAKFSTSIASLVQSVAIGKTTAKDGIADMAQQMPAISGEA